MKLRLSLIAIPALLLGLTACDIQQTEEGEMPKVDVDVEEGKMPEYDVQTGDVDVEEKEVTVPTLDYESPAEQAAEEKAGIE